MIFCMDWVKVLTEMSSIFLNSYYITRGLMDGRLVAFTYSLSKS